MKYQINNLIEIINEFRAGVKKKILEFLMKRFNFTILKGIPIAKANIYD